MVGPASQAFEEPGLTHFADQIVLRARQLSHPLCVGIDPYLDKIPPLFRRGNMAAGSPATADAVRDLCLAFVARCAERAVCMKPQSAFFEQLGPAGVAVLDDVMRAARAAGCPVVLDAKRGDIRTTADAYARAYLDANAAMPADSLTLNPYLGLDTLEPFVERARHAGRGLFILVKTSNPGSADFQDQNIDGAPLFDTVARALSPLAKELQGPKTGWSSIGVVVGATYPEQGERVRERLPNSLFLVPGYGAQGGGAADAVRNFVAGPDGLEGGVVNSSRGILFPEAAAGAGDASTWERAIDEALTIACEQLGEAVRQ
jgi:orotidine-5'-phosphate decarboxylase